MEKRVGFTLDMRQVELACEAFIASRLQDDEEAKATITPLDGGRVVCQIDVSKKRKPRQKRDGPPVIVTTAGPIVVGGTGGGERP